MTGNEEAIAPFDEVDTVVELAIGQRCDLARTLVSRGTSVVATDIEHRTVPDGVRFVQDDLLEPRREVYASADLLYAQRLPAELHRAALDLARSIDIPLYFTTLGFEDPAIPVDRITLPARTWYRAELRR